MSDDKNDEGKKPEDEINIDDLEINIEGFGEDDDLEAGADEEAPKLEEGELPQDLQDLVDQGLLSEEQAAEMAESGVEIKVVSLDNPEDLEALFGGQAGDLSELFNQKAAAPFAEVAVRHEHDSIDPRVMTGMNIQVDLPRRMNFDDVKVSIEERPVQVHPLMPPQKMNVVTIEGTRDGLQEPGGNYCPDVAGEIPTEYKMHVPLHTHPKLGTASDKDMVVEYSEEKGLVITIEATDETIQDQKELIAEAEKRMQQMNGFSL